jgi:Divergent InlB B-repeat domain
MTRFGCLIALLAACGDNLSSPPPIVTQTKMLTVELSRGGAGGGMIAATPAILNCTADSCTTIVKQGALITLHAVPDADSKLVAWTGPDCAAAGTGDCTLRLLTDVEIGATFAVKSFVLDVAHVGNGGGTVTSAPDGIECGSNCTATLELGATTTLTAVADGNSTFLGWTGGDCTGTGSCVVQMSADTHVQAAFGMDQTLVVSVSGTGYGWISSNDDAIACSQISPPSRPHPTPLNHCSETVAPGTMITLSVHAAQHSSFTGWGGACSGTDTCMVTVDQARLVTAQFAINNQTLQVVEDGNGTGTVTSDVGGVSCGATCSAQIPYGTPVTMTAVADSGSSFTGWSGVDCPGTGSCTFELVADTTVTATFASYGGLYAVDTSANLWRIDSTTFTPTNIGNLNIGMGDGDMAFDYGNGKIYLLDGTYLNNLYTVDITNATATLVTQIGPIMNGNPMFPWEMNFPEPALALGYDTRTGMLYMITLEGSFYSVNESTGALTPIVIGHGGWAPEGLIYDQVSDELITVGADYDTLMAIDPITGDYAPLIGQFAQDGIDLGATYDADHQRYLILRGDGTMIDIDPRNDYAATSIPGLPAPACALTYVAVTH